jgi:cell division protein FtsQ
VANSWRMRRLAFAFARTQSFRPLAALPSVPLPSFPSLRAPTRRELVLGAAALVALGAAYAGARESSLFAVRTVTIAGGPQVVTREARASLADVVGTSLVAVDSGDVAQRVAALPSVRTARVDRAFPHALTVVVEAERPLALIRRGSEAWVVAETGTVIRRLEPGEAIRLPRIRLAPTAAPRLGAPLGDREAQAAVEVLRLLPPHFPAAILSVRSAGGAVTAVLGGWIELRLGPPVDLRTKLAAAAAVLRSLSGDERRGLAYLDVGLPQRPVASTKSQLESEG